MSHILSSSVLANMAKFHSSEWETCLLEQTNKHVYKNNAFILMLFFFSIKDEYQFKTNTIKSTGPKF